MRKTSASAFETPGKDRRIRNRTRLERALATVLLMFFDKEKSMIKFHLKANITI